MVLVKTAAFAESTPVSNELCMDSGSNISFVAPVTLDSTKVSEHQHVVLLAQEKRLLFGDMNVEMDKWSGASDFCQCLDNIVETENEIDFFAGKRVLEVGFCTGLPSVYALEHRAENATLVYPVSLRLLKIVNYFADSRVRKPSRPTSSPPWARTRSMEGSNTSWGTSTT